MKISELVRKMFATSFGIRAAHFLIRIALQEEETHRYESDSSYSYYEKKYREEFFAKSMRFLQFNHLRGDYLEFGCYGGGTFGLAHKHKHLTKLKMKLYGFDSFRGLPKPTGIDIHDQWKEGDFAIGISEFEEKLRTLGIEPNEYKLIPGFYDVSLKNNPPNKIGITTAAFVYIDCDLYESTIPVLTYLASVLQTGTIVAFDDFYCFNGDPERGGQRALKEFLQSNPHIKFNSFLNIGWHGKSFIVKLSNNLATVP